MKNVSDKDLILRIRQSDKAAFRQLFDRHYSLLLGTAINLLRKTDPAKDMVQEVFLRIWKKREQLEIHSSVESYLKRSVINACLSQIKRDQAFVRGEDFGEDLADPTNALDDLAYEDLQAALQACLDTLPERCRLVFVMKRLEGLSQKEISEALSISPKTVENQMTKALKLLKNRLKSFRQKNE